MWSLRISVIVVGCVATVLAITFNSVFGLWYLALDVCAFVLFPQLTAVIFCPWTNAWGAAAGAIVGTFFRLSAGDPLLGIPPLIRYPYYDEESGIQYFPYRALSIGLTLLVILVVSGFIKYCPIRSGSNFKREQSNGSMATISSYL